MCGFGLRVLLLLVIVLAVVVILKRINKSGGMKMGIFGKFAKRKAEKINQDFKVALLKADFDTMTEAQLDELEETLNDATKELADAKRSFDKEVAEADQIEAAYQKKLKAAELLEAKVAAEENPDTKASIEASLTSLLAGLEEMVPEVEREAQEADDAKRDVEELTELVNTAASNLKNARKRLTGMKRELDRAERDEAKAKKRADNAAVIAGIKKQTDSMGGVFDTLQGEIDKKKTSAESARIKAESLRTVKTEEDPHIAAALAEASGEQDTSKVSLSDRLAALKK